MLGGRTASRRETRKRLTGLSARALGLTYERLVRRRVMLLATHVVLGVSVAVIWMSRQDFSRLKYWRRAAGIFALASALLAGWPYVASAVVSYRSTSTTRLGLAILEVILFIGALIGGAIYLGASSGLLPVWIVVVPLVQATVFLYAARRLTSDQDS